MPSSYGTVSVGTSETGAAAAAAGSAPPPPPPPPSSSSSGVGVGVGVGARGGGVRRSLPEYGTPRVSHLDPLLRREGGSSSSAAEDENGGSRVSRGGGGGGARVVVASSSHATSSLLSSASADEEDPSTERVDSLRKSGSLTESIRSVESLAESVKSFVDDALGRLPGGDRPCNVRDAGGTATVPNETFNMVKNLVGAGALGLPSGVAAYGNAPSALVPASVITVAMGAVFAYYFLLMGRICKMTYATTYREAWDATVGERASSLIALTTVLMAGLGNLAYSMILADTTRSLISAAGMSGVTRTRSLAGVTAFALLPLCSAKGLTVLAPFSLVGMAAMVFTLVAMVWRYADGTYDIEGGGKFLPGLDEDLRPSFGDVGARGALSPSALLLVCMTYQAYFAHYNAPRYYMELKDNTIQRFTLVVSTSFLLSALFYVIMTAFGYLTFGSNCDGFILNNYSDRDPLASVCRFAIAVALLFTYPLPFIGVRDGILDLMRVPPPQQTSAKLNVLTVIILTAVTLLAMTFDDLGMVNAVGGGSLGTLVVFVFPALMLRGHIKNLGKDATTDQRREAAFAVSLMWAGIVMGGVGVWVGVVGV